MQVGSYGQLPLAFELNQGQVDSAVEFLAHSAGASVFLTRDSAALRLTKSAGEGAGVAEHGPALPEAFLRLRLVGVTEDAPVHGEGELLGKVNYLIGNDPKSWHTNVPTFSKVRYQGVYPGIDLVYYGNGQRLEYDFVVAPGADPGTIQMSVDRARSLQVDALGELVIQLTDGELRWQRPIIYQLDGPRRLPVDGTFLVADNRVSFRVGPHDPKLQLVIDPVLVWSSYIGPVNNQRIGVALDTAGNFYLATTSTTTGYPVFPPSGLPPAFPQGNPSGGAAGVITKLTPDGTALVYSTYISNGTNTNVNAIAVDAAGDAFITGITDDGFPVTPNAYDATCAVQATTPPSCLPSPSFVAELNPQGTQLLYGTYLTGTRAGSSTTASGIAVDVSGNIFVAGSTTDATFPVVNAFQNALQDSTSSSCSVPCGDFFVSKLLPSAGPGPNSLKYSTYVGGMFQDGPDSYGNFITTDGNGKVFVVGRTASTNFPTMNADLSGSKCGTDGNCNGIGTVQSPDDAVLFELDTNQSGAASMIYSTYIGGSSFDSATSVALDATGKVYVAGWTQSVADNSFPTSPTGVFQSNCASINQNPFLMKFDTSQVGAPSVLWATCLGFNGAAYGLALDGTGTPYVSASSNDLLFPAANLVSPIQSDTGNLYIGKLSTDGTSLLWGTRFGSSSVQAFNSDIALDAAGDVYIGGVTTYNGDSSDLPTTQGSFAPTCVVGTNPGKCGVANAGAPALFAAKISPADGTLPVATPRSYVFGVFDVGAATASTNVVFRNIGNLPLAINSISFTGANASEFSIVTPGCGSSLVGGASCTEGIGFTPQSGGNKQATLTIDPPAVLDSVSLTAVVRPNIPPVAVNESVSTTTGTPIGIVLQGEDPAGFPLTYSIVTPPASGTLAAIAGSSTVYTTNAGFTGTDSFAYIANDGYLSSNIATVTITVSNATVATTTSLSTSLNPAAYGRSVTFTATVTAGSGTPTGTVQFLDGATIVGSANLSGGIGTVSTSLLTPGSHSITAAYTGESGFAASTSGIFIETIVQAAPIVTWASPSPITYGTALSATQLNATTNVPGSFAYSPAAGTVLSAGTQTLTATFTPSDATDYTTASAKVSQVINQATSSVVVTSSVNPSSTGQLVAFTASITPQLGGTATGSVMFYDGTTALGTVTVSSNAAALSTSALATGTHSITAVYSGDSNVLGATSGAFSQVVNASHIATTATLVSSLNPAYVTQTIVYTATVSAASGVPNGSVTFRQGFTTLAVVALVNGQATYSTAYTTTGTRFITASYAANGSYLASTSSVLAQSVTRVPTTIAAVTSASPQPAGLPVTFTATLSSPAGMPPDGGMVTFRDLGTAIGTGTTAGGVATFTTSSLTPGFHSISARYPGDITFAASTSTAISQFISKYATNTSVVSTLNPSTYGQPVTFTATVNPTGPFALAGTVTFRSGNFNLATVTLSGGTASFMTSALTAGTKSIAAVYSGDGNNATSTSPIISQTVNMAATTTTPTSSPNPSTFGSPVTLTATVTSAAGTPGGSITFRQGTTFIGRVALNTSGVATITTSSLPRGNISVTATYGGSPNYSGSTGSTTQTVN
jgi:hypothetical protein